MPPFTACLVQRAPVPYDKAGNLSLVLRTMDEARASGADLVLFPEMFLSGYLVKDQLAALAEPLDGPSLRAVGAHARALGMGVLLGLPLRVDGHEKPHNALVFFDRDGSVAGWSAKAHMFGGEERMFDPGDRLAAFDTSFGRVGLMICYDGEFPEVARTLALDGAQLLCMCAANMSPFEDYHAVYMRARAMENCVYGLYTNLVGDEKRFHYCGQSCAIGPDGRILAIADHDRPALLYCTVDLDTIPAADAPLRYRENRRPELYRL